MKSLIETLTALRNSAVTDEELVDIVAKHATAKDTRTYLDEQISNSTQGVRGYVHQLGFYKFVTATINGTWSRKVRLHFWKRSEITDDVHDHIASFASKVLYGSLINETFERVDSGEIFIHRQFSARGDGCNPSDLPASFTRLGLQRRAVIAPSSTYFLNYEQLHRAAPRSTHAISLVVQNSPIDRGINVFRKKADLTERPDSARSMSVCETRDVFEQMSLLLGGTECK